MRPLRTALPFKVVEAGLEDVLADVCPLFVGTKTAGGVAYPLQHRHPHA